MPRILFCNPIGLLLGLPIAGMILTMPFLAWANDLDGATPHPSVPWLPDEIVYERIEADLMARDLLRPDDGYTTRAVFQTWPDRCLGLPTAVEICLPEPTDGWFVQVGNAQDQPGYFYHTDLAGTTIRLFDAQAHVPEAMRRHILTTAATETGHNPEALTLNAIEPRIWESCPTATSFTNLLSMPNPCTHSGSLGWRAIVSDQNDHWVYHTYDTQGQTLQLNLAASLNDSAYEPHFAYVDFLVIWEPSAIFQTKITGGAEGAPTEIFYLTNDGILVHIIAYSDEDYTYDTYAISSEVVQHFQSLLQQADLSDFHWLLYSAPDGAQEYRRIEISDMQGLIFVDEYAQDTLPEPLQSVLRAWDSLIATQLP
jgi:hypothetical protein